MKKSKPAFYLVISFLALICWSFFPMLFSSKQQIFSLDTVDEYCEKSGDWHHLTNQTYFKKSAAFFIIDLSLISLNLIHYSHSKLNIQLILYVNLVHNNRLLKLRRIFNEYELYMIERWYSPFAYYTIKLDFNLKKSLGLRRETTLDYDQLDMNIEVHRSFSLNIKPKYSSTLGKGVKNSPSLLVCSKVVFLNDHSRFVNFKQWIRLNQRLGVVKIIVYNPPGYRSDFFTEFRDLVEFRQLTCMPNIVNTSTKYFKHYTTDLYKSMDTIAFLLINECYLNFIDNFDYIAVFDPDEILMVTDSNLSTKKSSWTALKRESIAKALDNSYNPSSVFFYYRFFIKQEHFDRFCDSLKIGNKYPIEIEVSLNFSIRISNHDEFVYAQSLCQLNDRLVKPLIKTLLNSTRTNFARFFVFDWTGNGKSIHDTSRAISIANHGVRKAFRCCSGPEEKTEYVDISSYYSDYKYGYTGHFRPVMEYGFFRAYFQISSIQFDSSYFNLFSDSRI